MSDEGRRLLEAATKRPWRRGEGEQSRWWLYSGDQHPAVGRTFPRGLEDAEADENAALIVAAVNQYAALLNIRDAAQQYADWTGGHHWRCEYRTAEKGWREGEPPVIECVCGHDRLRDALAALPQSSTPDLAE